MAIPTLYKGESRLRTIRLKLSDGTAMPHASITGLRVFLHIGDQVQAKYMKDEGDGAEDGFKLLTQLAGPGEYQFAIEGEESQLFKEGLMRMEVYRKSDQNGLNHYARVFRTNIYNVCESIFNTLNNA